LHPFPSATSKHPVAYVLILFISVINIDVETWRYSAS